MIVFASLDFNFSKDKFKNQNILTDSAFSQEVRLIRFRPLIETSKLTQLIPNSFWTRNLP